MKTSYWPLVFLLVPSLQLGNVNVSWAEDAKAVAAAVDKGNALFNKGDLDGSVAAFSEAIRLDPKNVVAYVGRGLAYSKQANSRMPDLAKPGSENSAAMTAFTETLGKARTDFDEAIRLDKKQVEDYLARRVAADKRPRNLGPSSDLMVLQIALQLAAIHRVEATLQEPATYEPFAETLALYCQSDPKSFPDDLEPEWFPAKLRKQRWSYAVVKPDMALIEFGGGFYHFGYSLERDEKASTSRTNVWQLFLRREDQEKKLLCAKSMPAARRLSADDLLKRVVGGYDDDLAAEPTNAAAYQGKIALLVRFDKVQEARAACKVMLEQLPDDWWANIVGALATAGEKSDAEAEKSLTAWAERKPDFFRFLDLAYYYQLRAQPAKAAAAMVKAAGYDANLARGDGGNSEYRGYSAALYAFRNGEYDAAIKLCDRLLPVRINGGYAKLALRKLKAAAEKRAKGEKVDFAADERIGDFKLLGTDFVEKLLQHGKRPRH